ncbi:31683_t:CDS:1, partial [Racocetra persica]
PEVLYNKKYSKASDVYSFGIIAYEIVSGIPAYNNITHDIKLQRNVYNGSRPSIPEHVPKLVAELIIKCWDDQPNKRPTSKEIYDIISIWNNDMSDDSSEIAAQIRKADEILGLNMSTLSHFNIYAEEIYDNRRFKPLNAINL